MLGMARVSGGPDRPQGARPKQRRSDTSNNYPVQQQPGKSKRLGHKQRYRRKMRSQSSLGSVPDFRMAMSWKNPFTIDESMEISVGRAGTVQCYHLHGVSGTLSANAVFALSQTTSALTGLPVVVSAADPVRALGAFRPQLACFMRHPISGEEQQLNVTAAEKPTSINSRHAVCPMMHAALVRAYWSVLAVAHYLGIQDSTFLRACPCKWEIAIPSSKSQRGAQLPD